MIKVAYWNSRGKKRAGLDSIRYLKQRTECDLAFVTETHRTFSPFPNYHGSFYRNNARGTAAISFNPKIKISPIDRDSNGRWNDCSIKYEQHKWNTRICYAPAKSSERKTWMNNNLQSNKLDDLDILVGDFNCTVKNRQHISTQATNSTTHEVGRAKLNKYAHDLSLVHVYDTNKLLTPPWTFSSPKHRSVIDHMFVSPYLAQHITKIEVLPGPTKYEHDIVLVTFTLPKSPQKFGKDVKRIKIWIWDRNCQEPLRPILQQLPTNLAEWELWKRRAFQELKDFEQSCIRIRNERKKQLKFFLTSLVNSPFQDQARREANKLMQEDREDNCVKAGIDKRLHNEIPSRYLTRRIKARSAAMFIDSMTDTKNNQTLKSQNHIQAHLVDFFSNIFKRREHNNNNIEILLKSWNIPELDTSSLINPITEEEVLNTIKLFKKSKAPGKDGLPAEFYHLLADKLVPTLTLLFNKILRGEESIPPSIKSSIIRTIPKGSKDPNIADNRRPISLLNVDYKIFTKILNQRLLPIVNKVIINTQNGFLPGRNINNNIATMEECIIHLKSNAAKDCETIKKELKKQFPHNVTFQSEQESLKYLSKWWNSQSITLIDFAKAFDSISHHAIQKVLTHIGCPPLFVHAIMECLSKTSAQVIVNGYLSKPFPIERGAKQGDTISPTLFILVIEMFNQAIHNDPSIGGVNIGNFILKGLFFADDAVIIAINNNALIKIWDWLTFFCKASTMEVSQKKCKGIKIGNRAFTHPKLQFLPLSTSPERYLGIYVSKQGLSTSKDLLTESTNNLENWKQGSHTLKTKCCILNTYLFSKWWYQIKLAKLKDHDLNSLKNVTTWFFWKSHTKYDTSIKYRNTRSQALLHSRKEHGGLELNNPEIKYLALKTRYFHQIMSRPNSLAAIAWKQRISIHTPYNNTWFVPLSKLKPPNKYNYAIYHIAKIFNKIYNASNQQINLSNVNVYSTFSLKEIYWLIYDLLIPKEPFSDSQKKWMNNANFDLQDAFSILHQSKAIPNATNFLWKYLHRCLPGMFPDNRRWHHISDKQKRIIFESEHAQRLSSSTLPVWESLNHDPTNAIWEESFILHHLSQNSAFAYFAILTAHAIWKSYCDFTHGHDQWSNKKAINYVKWEWTLAAQSLINKNLVKHMDFSLSEDQIIDNLPSRYSSTFQLNKLAKVKLNRTTHKVILIPL